MKKSTKKLRTLRDLETKQAAGCGDMDAPPRSGDMQDPPAPGDILTPG